MAEILVVDDERMIRVGLKRLLESEGYEVRFANNGEQALEELSRARPDLVLLDLMMPVMNGFATLQELREIDPLLPIIILTAVDTDLNRVRGLDLGADDCIAKTDSNEVKLATIRRALDRAEAVRTAANGPRRLYFGETLVDFDALTVKGPDVDERLTRTEADILWLLCTDRGAEFTYGEILEVALGVCADSSELALRTHICRMKKKLGRAGELVQNVRGSGYLVVAADVSPRRNAR